ncbi:uncharacterized protein K452DRAFT_348827 [Aplosporella prunicola CBS 121167]|uniref:Uncharacterized protein n=1 Tax=Aplosporella prunicola CBS 121167 TaxID=1176127 RepID=A0A6A6BQ49_9PEZI|nr:uncharacterized protein K452DRAFT_348827 [Aplosporella prunicola CBS 121167]KAF2146252.1 hypothetical protein K452DRAFT_348827 [Aplosporella prunicola CBS 121167]
MQQQVITHAQLIRLLSSYLPPRPNDVSFLYHTPRHSYDQTTSPVSHVVLSVTPTPGVYAAINNRPHASPPPVCFLHRPWGLDRRAIPRGALVLASHVAFDAFLTVGWNVSLAERLDLRVEEAVCVRGYKSDVERPIGLVAPLRSDGGSSLEILVEQIKHQFGGFGDLHIPASWHGSCTDKPTVTVMAIMNAFNADEVSRALATACSQDWISNTGDGKNVLYVTGQARESGLKAASIANMPVVSVGHRACEDYGIRFLASKLRECFPAIIVEEIYENEEPRVA